MTMREIRELNLAELEAVSGGLLSEISQGVKVLADAAADFLAGAALEQGCLLNPADGTISSCPKNPPPV